MFVFRGEQFSLTEQKALKEGCQIYGYLEVKNVFFTFCYFDHLAEIILPPSPPLKKNMLLVS